MKKIMLLFAVLAVLLAGCGTADHQADSSAPAEEAEARFSCAYSNLTDEAARQEVDTALKEAGVSDSRRAALWTHVEQFNEAVDTAPLVGGFQTGDILTPAYDPYEYQDQWMERYPDFNGYNCRITAFSLLGDVVTVKEDAEIRDNELFMDVESLNSDPSALQSEGELDTFRRLFSSVPTENTTDAAVHIEAVLKDWEERGVSFDEDNGLSLVTVWFHNQWSEEENELFIGHTGVLAETESGLYFIEKVAFQEPYQAIKLRYRGELKDILTERYDVEWGQSTAKPFIMENKAPLWE